MTESEVLEVRIGDEHITPEQIMDVNIGTYGPGDYVLPTGQKLEAQLLSNNSIRIFDGAMVYCGVRDVIAVNNYHDVTIENGQQGMNRNDIIVRHFAKNEETQFGGAEFQVIKGTATSGDATDPEITDTDLRAGALTHDMKIYRARLEGLNVVAVEPLFEVLPSIPELNGKMKADDDWSAYSDNGWEMQYRHISQNQVYVEVNKTSTGNNAAIVGDLVMAGVPFTASFGQNVPVYMDVSGSIVGYGRANFATNNGLYLYTPAYGNSVSYTVFGIVTVE